MDAPEPLYHERLTRGSTRWKRRAAGAACSPRTPTCTSSAASGSGSSSATWSRWPSRCASISRGTTRRRCSTTTASARSPCSGSIPTGSTPGPSRTASGPTPPPARNCCGTTTTTGGWFRYLHDRAMRGAGVHLSMTDCYRETDYGEPIVGLKELHPVALRRRGARAGAGAGRPGRPAGHAFGTRRPMIAIDATRRRRWNTFSARLRSARWSMVTGCPASAALCERAGWRGGCPGFAHPRPCRGRRAPRAGRPASAAGRGNRKAPSCVTGSGAVAA